MSLSRALSALIGSRRYNIYGIYRKKKSTHIIYQIHTLDEFARERGLLQLVVSDPQLFHDLVGCCAAVVHRFLQCTRAGHRHTLYLLQMIRTYYEVLVALLLLVLLLLVLLLFAGFGIFRRRRRHRHVARVVLRIGENGRRHVLDVSSLRRLALWRRADVRLFSDHFFARAFFAAHFYTNALRTRSGESSRAELQTKKGKSSSEYLSAQQ